LLFLLLTAMCMVPLEFQLVSYLPKVRVSDRTCRLEVPWPDWYRIWCTLSLLGMVIDHWPGCVQVSSECECVVEGQSCIADLLFIMSADHTGLYLPRAHVVIVMCQDLGLAVATWPVLKRCRCTVKYGTVTRKCTPVTSCCGV
jgi:hypothetical protein